MNRDYSLPLHHQFRTFEDLHKYQKLRAIASDLAERCSITLDEAILALGYKRS